MEDHRLKVMTKNKTLTINNPIQTEEISIKTRLSTMSRRLMRLMRAVRMRILDKRKECQGASFSAKVEKRISMKEAVRLE